MARTVWGNILELMAGTGLHGAMNLGTQAIMQPMLAKRQAQQQVLEGLLPVMGTETDPVKSGVIADKIKEISGVDLHTGLPETNQAGYEGRTPTGQVLTIPKATPLEELAPGVQTQPGFIRPKTAAMLNKETTLAANRENLLAKLAVQESEGALNRQSREVDKKESRDLTQYLGELQHQDRQDRIASDQQKFAQTLMLHKAILNLSKDKFAGQEQQKYTSRLDKLMEEISMYAGAKKWDAVAPLVEQYNTSLTQATNKHPDIGEAYFPLDYTKPEKFLFKPNIEGRIQTKVPKTATAPTDTGRKYPFEVEVDGQRKIVYSDAEYDELKKKYSQ